VMSIAKSCIVKAVAESDYHGGAFRFCSIIVATKGVKGNRGLLSYNASNKDS